MATTVTLKPNAIDISGSTSGTTTLQATAVAGTTVLTLPAATDTLVGKATTDTLTNKTLTSPVLITPALGTPASGVVTNLTGTASININGTVGATTANTGAFTTLSATGVATLSAGTAALPAITTTSDTNTGIFFPAADTIAFTEGGAEAMRIDSSGNVGIGTASPSYKLDITGSTARIYNDSAKLLLERPTNSRSGSISLTGSTGAIQYYAGNNGAGEASNVAHQFYSDSPSTLSELMTILGGGNVGIGTSSPAANLEVKGASGQNIYVSYTSGSQLRLKSDSGDSGIGTTGATPLLFLISNGEKARIDSSGHVLINATSTSSFSAAAKLCVLGVAAEFAAVFRAPDTGNYNVLSCDNPNGQVGKIQTSGSATSFLTSSDYRLKENIAPMTGALAKVAALKPVTYKWKVDGADGQGFIAHELAEVVPDCVGGDKDAVDANGNPQYQGVDTSFLVATLTAAIQEQQALITSLTARITALEST